jgi:hypothetical protein
MGVVLNPPYPLLTYYYYTGEWVKIGLQYG